MNIGMILYMVAVTFILGLVIYGVLSIIMKIFDKRSSDDRENSALKILKERLAKGEISEEEFEQTWQFIKAKE